MKPNKPFNTDQKIGEAAYFIGNYCRKWGRINVTQTKEKYGTARVYCSFGLYDLHSLTHPGYHYIQYKGFLKTLNYTFVSRLISTLNFVVVPYQKWIYHRAYNLAFKKYSYIKKGIIQGADYPEIISPYFESVALCSEHSVGSHRYSLDENKCVICKEQKN